MKNKKKLLIASMLLLVLLCGTLITSCGSEKEAAKENQTVTAKVKNSDTKKEKDDNVSEEVVDAETLDKKSAATPVETLEATEEKSSENKKSTVETKAVSTKKEETSSSNKTTNKVSTTTTSTNKNTSSSTHTHKWVASTTTVHHDEEGHYENVCVKKAWTEEKPVYSNVQIVVCTTCGSEIEGNTTAHIKEHMLNGENGHCVTQVVLRQTGTKIIEHPAEYEKQWVVDKAAWDETITTYKCSCGATK